MDREEVKAKLAAARAERDAVDREIQANLAGWWVAPLIVVIIIIVLIVVFGEGM